MFESPKLAECSDWEILSWIALNRLPDVGPATVRKIIAHYGTPEEFFREKGFNCLSLKLSTEAIELASQFAQQGMASKLGVRSIPDLEWQGEDDHSIVTFLEKTYPQKLKLIPSPPALLYIKGSVELLNSVQLGVVGSRSPTPEGLRNATNFAFSLSRKGVVITSGLALGVDGAAHQGVLNARQSAPTMSVPTVAVVGNGLDQVYPKRHSRLASQIIESGGALITEFPIGTAPKAQNFPRRNRVISGMSVGVLVVEATLKSGSLITARYAIEQGKEVYAIPGSIHSPQSRGTHRLIRQGAKLVEFIDDIVEELPYLFDNAKSELGKQVSLFEVSLEEGNAQLENQYVSQETSQLAKVNPDDLKQNSVSTEFNLNKSESLILGVLGNQPKSVDSIISAAGLSVRKTVSILSVLELKKLVKSMPGGFCKTLV